MEILSAQTCFTFCFDFCQLPDGRWAGKSYNAAEGGWIIYISKRAYSKYESPERFKYEPCQVADEDTSNLYYKLTY